MTPYILTALAFYTAGRLISTSDAYRRGHIDGMNSQIEDTNVRRGIL